jgi:hypothetical protein
MGVTTRPCGEEKGGKNIGISIKNACNFLRA